MTVEVAVFCDQDYFGESCDVYCHAENDAANGHYACSNGGQKQCLKGNLIRTYDSYWPHCSHEHCCFKQLGERNLIFIFTGPRSLFFPIWKKNQNEEIMIFKLWKFCNSASCLHNMLSQRTAASNTECKIIQKSRRLELMCEINLSFKKWTKKFNTNRLTPFSLSSYPQFSLKKT